MTVRELAERLDAQEFAEWRWIYTIEYEEQKKARKDARRGRKGKASTDDDD